MIYVSGHTDNTVSSKDLITLLTCAWIFSICCGKCIGAYLSDISGAFDRVFKPYLMEKLRAAGIGETYLKLLSSFLDRRFGRVCVQGQKSWQMLLENQVFQGTVLGPPLWNIFFSDVVSAMLRPKSGKAFADDLNVFHEFDRLEQTSTIMAQLQLCRDRVHEWGYRNRVEFDGTKEFFVTVHPTRGVGNDFKILGLVFDCKLHMEAAIAAILAKARPKCRALMRTKPFYNTADMILQFKTHISGILESNIGGIYHATATVLAPLDRVATTFAHFLNLDIDYAFLHFNLAPLGLRRDIAMLGFLHKCNLPHAHPHIRDLFPARPATSRTHSKQMWDIMGFQTQRTFHNEIYRRSIFHVVHVYNALPRRVVDCSTVSALQHELSQITRHIGKRFCQQGITRAVC